METPPPPPLLSPPPIPSDSIPASRALEMEIPPTIDETSTGWEWANLLDFTVNDELILWDSDDQLAVSPETLPAPEVAPEPSIQKPLDRVRKRDPRLGCPNFSAGRVPCSCPELDEKEEEEGGLGKKRARRIVSGTVRCQVPGCEADIRELKGYHRRHRVCLGCANASAVVIDGHSKRYCQQCGKFHMLSDFDEGKRSCRRKLERHNTRRRRKSIDSSGAVEKEPEGGFLAEDNYDDGGAEKDSLCLNNQKTDLEKLLDSEDGQVSPSCLVPSPQNIQIDSVVSFVASREIQLEGGKDTSKYALSSSLGDNKGDYSSMCPTGRISFKLYDWNPAEFPRRLRHQIFEWLANMPVELEGYIRPGCTILTAFIATPRFMWEMLSVYGASYVHDFVVAPGSMLSGRGTILVGLNNMTFRVRKDGTSVTNVKVEMRAPRLHYVRPSCFEAGKPMEFFACGSNLIEPKLRFLVSFAGKYLVYDYCIAVPHGKTEGYTAESSDHQIYKIYIPHTDPKLFGPAFIEVENKFGLSNFIPVVFAAKEICSEIQILQQKLDESYCLKRSRLAAIDSFLDSCEVSASRQMALSDLLLDIGWLLKEPKLENTHNFLSSTQFQRFSCLLNFLIQNESIIILEKVLESLKIVMDKVGWCSFVNRTEDADAKLFQKYIDHARDIVCQRLHIGTGLVLHSGKYMPKGEFLLQRYNQNDLLFAVPGTNQHMGMGGEQLGAMSILASQDGSRTIPLVNGEVMNINPPKSCGRIISKTLITSYPLVLIVATIVTCVGMCAVLFHPHKVMQLAVSIRRCLFDNS